MRTWIRSAVALTFGMTLAGCGMEGDRVTLMEVERLQRETDKQMRLVREQNLTLNEKVNRVNARLDIIENQYIPAVNAAMDSVTSHEQTFRTDIVGEVEDRLAVMSSSVRGIKNELAEEMTLQSKEVLDQVRENMTEVDARLGDVEGFVHYVAARQDSVNEAMIGRVDRKAGYSSFLSGWTRSGAETAGPSF